jgi:DNA repair protein RecO (recombination protein O)
MASEKTDAIVLRVVNWSETSCIVTLLTHDFGIISGLAKGARRLKSPFESAIDLLALCRIVFIPKVGDVLDLLTEAKLIRRFRSSQQSLLSLYCGYYVAELITATVHSGQPLQELFDITDLTLRELDEGKSPFDLTLRFEMQLLRILGHSPSLELCATCGETLPVEPFANFGLASGGLVCRNCLAGQSQLFKLRRASIETMIQASQPIEATPTMPSLTSENRYEIRRTIQRYLSFHIDRKLQLHDLLEDLAR